jgi:hypothetical protein
MNDAGGTIAALNGDDAVSATASVVELLDDVIVGGTLKTSNFGTIETITNNGAATTTVFDGLANQGYVLVNDNTTLVLRNTINNTDGKIALALSGQSDLQIDGTVTLKSGEVELNTSGDAITALATGATLDNTANIHGQGQIGAGDGKLTLDNQTGGVVNVDQAIGTVTIHTGNTVTNAGTLEATGSGSALEIFDSVTNSGTIGSYGSHSSVVLQGATLDNSGTVIADGLDTSIAIDGDVTNEIGGTIEALEGTLNDAIFFGGGSVTNYGLIKADNSGITIGGPITNHSGGIIEAHGGSITFSTNNPRQRRRDRH